jgi:hypothetical protein
MKNDEWYDMRRYDALATGSVCNVCQQYLIVYHQDIVPPILCNESYTPPDDDEYLYSLDYHHHHHHHHHHIGNIVTATCLL